MWAVRNKIFISRRNLANPQIMHSESSPHGGDICDEADCIKTQCIQEDNRLTQVTVIRSFQLKKIHKGDKSYNCDVCEIRFSFRNNVKQHILVYDADPANRPKVSCRKCDRVWESRNSQGPFQIKAHW